MSKVDEAIVEIDQTLAEMAPRHEGLRDYSRLNLEPDTMSAVNAAIQQYDRRTTFLNIAKVALQELQADGHPVLDVREVSESVLHDLQANSETILAALARFASNAAIGMGLAGSTPELK